MKEYLMHVIVHKANGNSFADHILVEANDLFDAQVEASNKADTLTNGQQRVESLGTGYVISQDRGCRW